MNELKTTTKLVKAILEENKQARNSDSFLYFKVIQREADQKGVDLRELSVASFLLGMNVFGFTKFETVRRTRQKIQAMFPELAACDKVADMREVQEYKYRTYANDRGAMS